VRAQVQDVRYFAGQIDRTLFDKRRIGQLAVKNIEFAGSDFIYFRAGDHAAVICFFDNISRGDVDRKFPVLDSFQRVARRTDGHGNHRRIAAGHAAPRHGHEIRFTVDHSTD